MATFTLQPSGADKWLRRARPLLGTLVDVGVPVGHEAALHAAFQALTHAQKCMSAHEAGSDLTRAHRASVGEPVRVDPATAEVLGLAEQLHAQTDGLFDVALASGRWRVDMWDAQPHLTRLDEATHIDLGGIAKGWAVDQAVLAAQALGAPAVWVNAGGDLRTQGVCVPVYLRDEACGGVRPWAEVCDGALATSDFGDQARSKLSGQRRSPYLSVAAPLCVWADALTKVMAILGRPDHPVAEQLLVHHRAQVWFHQTRYSLPAETT